MTSSAGFKHADESALMAIMFGALKYKYIRF